MTKKQKQEYMQAIHDLTCALLVSPRYSTRVISLYKDLNSLIDSYHDKVLGDTDETNVVLATAYAVLHDYHRKVKYYSSCEFLNSMIIEFNHHIDQYVRSHKEQHLLNAFKSIELKYIDREMTYKLQIMEVVKRICDKMADYGKTHPNTYGSSDDVKINNLRNFLVNRLQNMAVTS